MRTGPFLSIVTTLLAWLPAVAFSAEWEPRAVNGGRVVVEMLAEWKFHRGPATDAWQTAYDDSDWLQITVPHDWSIAGPFDESHPASGEGGFLPTGVAWYRRALPDSVDLTGKRVFVEFDGVMANSDVWINGQRLGHRPNGYVPFRYEITDHLTRGDAAGNVLAVRADTKEQVASRWYTGSGIYRKVRLIIVDPLHIEDRSVFVTTPSVASEQAKVRATFEVVNLDGSPQRAVVVSRLLDSSGTIVATQSSEHDFDAGKTKALAIDFQVAKPQLWNLHEPRIYTAEIQLHTGGQVVDRFETSFGIRQAEFRAETGFWLNGQNTKIKGVCLHHDGGAFGAAVPKSIWRDRLERLKALGVNAIRTAHNPPSPEFLDLCDELGFVVMCEFFDCWKVGKRTHDYHKFFEDWWRRDLEETICRVRNHPSIVLYSVGNEIRDTHRPEQAKRILGSLVDVCHGSDPTRPVTQGLFRPNTTHDYDNGLADLLDVIGTNYRDAELLAAWRDKPGRKIIGTEQSHERSTWLACRDSPPHAGQFLWVGIDYLGESRRWPITTFNSGLLDRTGRQYPRAYERQSWWSDEPMVRAFRRVAPTEATPTDPGYEVVEWRRRRVLFDDWSPYLLNHQNPTETVEVYSNCESVQLELNGRALGAKSLPADARPRVWKVPFERGTLVAIGTNDGAEVARHVLRSAGEAASLQAKCNRSKLTSDWDDVATIRVAVVDGNATQVPSSNHEIEFEVEGPGEIVAVDNGSIVSHEPFQASRRRAYQGECVAFVQATGESGEIRVTARCDDLAGGSESAVVTLRAEP